MFFSLFNSCIPSDIIFLHKSNVPFLVCTLKKIKALLDLFCADIFLFSFEVVFLVHCLSVCKTVTVDRALPIKFSFSPHIADNQSPYL